MGKFANFLQRIFGRSTKNKYSYNVSSPLFSSFGHDIYASDIVKTAIHRIAEEVSKCKVRSVIEMPQDKTCRIVDDDINAVLNSWVNPLCNAKDFWYKVAWLLMANNNCFIYWDFLEVPVGNNGLVKRITKGLYPIEARTVKIYTTTENELRIELINDEGTVFDMPYHDLIHIRHKFGANGVLGGDSNGCFDTSELLKNLQTMHVIKEAIPKSLEASLSLKGILTMKTVADADKKAVTRGEFEEHLFKSKLGIVVTDYESDFSPININATDIPSNILAFVRDEILSLFGVSVPIYLGKYTDEEFASFYQTAIEGVLESIAKSFTCVLFTPRQISYGHQIKVYDRLVQSLSYKERKSVVEMVKDSALLSRAEQRELLGYEPDGEPTRVSLNFVDTAIANTYQLQNLKKEQKDARR